MIGLEYLLDINNMQSKQLAKMLGVGKATVSSWINKKRLISTKHYEKLKEIFKVPEEYFQREISELDQIELQKIKIDNDKLRLFKERKMCMLNNKIKNIDKTTIILDQAISKANGEEFTNEELEEFLNDYIEWIESKGLITGGRCGFDRGEE